MCGCLHGSIVKLSNGEPATHKGQGTVFIRPFLEEACLSCVQGSTGLKWDAAALEPCLSLSWHQSSALFSGPGGGGSLQQRVPETLCGSWQITSTS